MALKKFGLLTIARQPDSELIYTADGYVEGQLIYDFDWAQLATVKATVGSTHPDEANVYLHRARIQKMHLGKGRVTFDCIGLTRDPTVRQVEVVPMTSTTRIEAHKDFISTLAGTPDAPLNGAEFDEETGEFLGFFSGELTGVASFYDGGSGLRATYYTAGTPQFSRAFKIAKSLPNAPSIPGIDGYLYLPPASVPVPNTPFMRVTEDLLPITNIAAARLIYA